MGPLSARGFDFALIDRKDQRFRCTSPDGLLACEVVASGGTFFQFCVIDVAADEVLIPATQRPGYTKQEAADAGTRRLLEVMDERAAGGGTDLSAQAASEIPE